MADHPERSSPLHGLADALAAADEAPARVRLSEVPFLTQLTLRVTPSTAAATAAGYALGAPLPMAPNTTSAAGEVQILWMGPDEWLVIGPTEARAQVVLLARTREPAYWVFVRASFAEYLAEWLLDASGEYRGAPPADLSVGHTTQMAEVQA